jgi:hypothetical protein
VVDQCFGRYHHYYSNQNNPGHVAYLLIWAAKMHLVLAAGDRVVMVGLALAVQKPVVELAVGVVIAPV